jgi:hypothetical protein
MAKDLIYGLLHNQEIGVHYSKKNSVHHHKLKVLLSELAGQKNGINLDVSQIEWSRTLPSSTQILT